MTRSAYRFSLLATLVWALPVSSLAAQDPEPDTLGPAVPVPGITVTVLRAPFPLTAVPFAVAVNEKVDIQRAKPGLGLDEALHAIPGVQVDNRFNYALGERISIRGMGARAQFGVRGVKVLLDGIPATMPDGQTTLNHVDLGFIRRAEVVRGPASSLYGNAAGGVIQLETEHPPDAALGQELGLIAGGDGLLRIHSTTGGRSSSIDYVVNVARLSYSGHRDFSAAENMLINARVGFEGDRDRLHLSVAAVDYDAQNPGSLSQDLLANDRTQAFEFNRVQQTGEAGRHGQIGALWRRDTGAGELELVAYALGRRLENPIPPRVIDLERSAGGVRALFRSPAAVRKVRWTVGVESDLQRDDRRNFVNEEGRRGDRVLDQLEQVTAAGFFAQTSAELATGLRLMGGARYDRLRFAVADRLIAAENPDDSGERTMDAVSPSVGLSYSATPGFTIYGNVATAFETPTTTELANRPAGAGGFNPELEPQYARSYELGAKGAPGGAISYQVSVYRTHLDNSLIPFEVPDVPARQFFRNAGSALHEGLETALAVPLPGGALARVAYTYTDARFIGYVVDGTAFDGNRVPGVAPHRVETALSYRGPRTSFVELDGTYVSEMAVNDANTAHSPAYTVVHFRTGIEALTLGRVELTPFVGITNLFDREYNTSVVINAFGGRFYEPGPGRSAYIGARLNL